MVVLLVLKQYCAISEQFWWCWCSLVVLVVPLSIYYKWKYVLSVFYYKFNIFSYIWWWWCTWCRSGRLARSRILGCRARCHSRHFNHVYWRRTIIVGLCNSMGSGALQSLSGCWPYLWHSATSARAYSAAIVHIQVGCSLFLSRNINLLIFFN